jgi:hypothetical protein
VNRAFLSPFAIWRTRSSSFDTLPPALRPARDLLAVFPLAGSLPSTTSAAMALFGGFAGTMDPYDFPRSFISGLWPQPSLSGQPADLADGRTWDLPVLAHGNSVHALVLGSRGVLGQLAK